MKFDIMKFHEISFKKFIILEFQWNFIAISWNFITIVCKIMISFSMKFHWNCSEISLKLHVIHIHNFTAISLKFHILIFFMKFHILRWNFNDISVNLLPKCVLVTPIALDPKIWCSLDRYYYRLLGKGSIWIEWMILFTVCSFVFDWLIRFFFSNIVWNVVSIF